MCSIFEPFRTIFYDLNFSFQCLIHYIMAPTESNGNDLRTRIRRTQSVTRAEEITDQEQKQRQSQPDKP